MTDHLAPGMVTLAVMLFLGQIIYYWLIDRWGRDELDYHDVPPARSNVRIRRGVYDQDGAA